jgi:hypothetical protein
MPIRLLILTPYDSAAELAADRVAGRWLLHALARRGVAWELAQPWRPLPALAAFDAVLCWSYRFGRNNYLYWARLAEQRCTGFGLPVVHGVARCDATHSYFLQTWREHGIPCAGCRRFARFGDLGLAYPLILRRDGVHMGQDVHLVRTPEEARRLIESRLCDLVALPRREGPKGRLDLAVEFVDTADECGLYRKWRSYVIGGRVLPRMLNVSRHWLVNFGNLIEDEAAVAEDRAFVHGGEPQPDLVRRAARLTGSDVVALDYGRRRDGSYVFWEANRHFLMLGDKGYEQPERMQAATGRTPEEREAEDERVGLAIADLVVERAAGAASPSLVEAAAGAGRPAPGAPPCPSGC